MLERQASKPDCLPSDSDLYQEYRQSGEMPVGQVQNQNFQYFIGYD